MSELKRFYDVIIIGSGVGGGALANRLAESGRNILMIERGPRLPREDDNWSVDAVFHQKNMQRPKNGATRMVSPSAPARFIMSAATANSSVRRPCAFAGRISVCRMKAALPRPGRFPTMSLSLIMLWPNG